MSEKPRLGSRIAADLTLCWIFTLLVGLGTLVASAGREPGWTNSIALLWLSLAFFVGAVGTIVFEIVRIRWFT